MYKEMERLSKEQTKELVGTFMKAFGKRLKAKRKHVNLSQKELAECLETDASTLSRYESGSRKMQVSMLPLWSVYCDFPMRDLFPEDESANILNTFTCAVRVVVNRKKRQEKLRQKREERLLRPGYEEEKKLKGHIYEVDGREVFEAVLGVRHREETLKERYRNGDIGTFAEPCSDQELCDYVKKAIPEKTGLVMDAGQLLGEVMDVPGKSTLCNNVADYILDTALFDDIVKTPNERMLNRIYAYYKKMYDAFSDEDPKSRKP